MTQTSYRTRTDAELAEIMATADEAAADAIIAEMTRRDRKAAQTARDAARWAAVYAEWHDMAHTQFAAAETEINGYMLNRAGRDAGIDPWSLWNGSAARIAQYGSEELRSFFDRHQRLTVSEYRAQQRREAAAERAAYEGE